jgi:drug/metabolite transporter (DMT)-like permease
LRSIVHWHHVDAPTDVCLLNAGLSVWRRPFNLARTCPVLTAAFCHAYWNFLLKRTGGGPGMLTAIGLTSAAILSPIALGWAWVKGYTPDPTALAAMVFSGVLHGAYFLMLDRAYRTKRGADGRGGGDLSVVYPLARATGPLLTVILAVLLMGERPGAGALLGAVFIGVAAVVLTGDPRKIMQSGGGQAVGFALATGAMIACYTLFDKFSVATLLIPPLIFDVGCNVFRCAMLVPYAERRQSGSIGAAWRAHRGTIVAIAILSPMSYILVLTAMVTTPVSYVAPLREVSILIAAFLGAHVLAEGDVVRRLCAAAVMVVGATLIALG